MSDETKQRPYGSQHWHGFKAMMEAAGWVENFAGFFVNGEIRYYPSGEYVNAKGTESMVGTWQEWYKAGDTPPAF